MTPISTHFTLEEALFSSTALRLDISNLPAILQKSNISVASNRLEAVRRLLDAPMHVDSWFRCPQLNKAVGGSPNSAHMDGWAIDFTCSAFGEPDDIVRYISESDIKFDQLIAEGNWVHISFDPKMRQQTMTAHFKNGVATYTNGVTNA